jgi:hypothetical protein
MADDVTINTGAGQPGATNVVVASDDVAGKQFQRMKLDYGTDGASIPVTTATPLPVELPDAALTGSGAIRVGTTSTKFFEGFGTWPNALVWDETVGSGDANYSGGNCAGVSYLGVRKSVSTPNTVTEIVSKSILSTPFEANLGLSLSNHIQGQLTTVDFVGVNASDVIEADAVPASVTISSLTVLSNVVTVTTATAHGYPVGALVALSGNLDNRFNQGPIAIVNVLSPTTFTFAYTIGDATYSAGGLGVVDLVCPCVGAYNSLGVSMMETNNDNVRYFTRGSQGPVFVSGAVSLGTDWRESAIPSGYDVYGADAHNARANLYLRYRQEQFMVQTRTNDNNGTPLNTGYVRTQNLPDPRKSYKLRARIVNLKNLTRPVARISSIAKAGTTTTTVIMDVTCASIGLVSGNYVSIIGVADQTNFVNTNNVIVTVTGASTFTCVVAGTGTATVTTGGSVFICEGNQSAPTLGQGINSISRTGNVLSVVGNATWTGMSRGEWYTLHGMSGSATQYEGTYRLLNNNTSTLTFESVGTDFGSITTGGSVIENTIFRFHQAAILDLTRFKAEIASGPGTNVDMDAISVRGTVTAASSGDYNCIGKAAHGSNISGNPVRVGARALNANVSTLTSGQTADLITTLVGALVQRPYSLPELEWTGVDSITASATAIQVKEATTSNHNYVTGLTISNATLGSAGTIQLRSTPVASTTATIATNTLVMAATYGWKIGDLVLVTASTVVGLTAGTHYYIKSVSGASLTFSATRGGATATISGTSVVATLTKILWRTTLQTAAMPPQSVLFNSPINGGLGLAIEMCTPTSLTSGIVDFSVQGFIAP